ncbi:MAG: cobalt-precorrin-6A reductase [Rhizobiaceae bacterium]
MSDRILILGGTREAAELAQRLVAEGHDVISSLAGRTREPKPIAGKTRIGGFGGREKLADWIGQNAITRVIDATHPFAHQISKNAEWACREAGVPLRKFTRQPWRQETGDNWIEVDSLDQAAAQIPANARVLLALGSQHLTAFAHRSDVHFLVRMVDAPLQPPDLPDHQLLLGRPSTDWRKEAELLNEHAISHIVCRNSGGSGAYAKIIAARELALPVIILKMPQ